MAGPLHKWLGFQQTIAYVSIYCDGEWGRNVTRVSDIVPVARHGIFRVVVARQQRGLQDNSTNRG